MIGTTWKNKVDTSTFQFKAFMLRATSNLFSCSAAQWVGHCDSCDSCQKPGSVSLQDLFFLSKPLPWQGESQTWLFWSMMDYLLTISGHSQIMGVNLPPGPLAIIHPYIQGDDPTWLAAGIYCFQTVFTLLGLHYNVLLWQLCYRFSL